MILESPITVGPCPPPAFLRPGSPWPDAVSVAFRIVCGQGLAQELASKQPQAGQWWEGGLSPWAGLGREAGEGSENRPEAASHRSLPRRPGQWPRGIGQVALASWIRMDWKCAAPHRAFQAGPGNASKAREQGRAAGSHGSGHSRRPPAGGPRALPQSGGL